MSERRGKVIIGVDPGTQVTGYGVIFSSSNSIKLLDYGCIRPQATLELAYRYRIIFEELSSILDRNKPSELAVETQFVQKNVTAAIKLGMARGVIMLAATLREIRTFEYAPTYAKRSVTGYGQASKEQVERMVRCLTGEREAHFAEDAADAIAIAICHANQSYSCTPISVVN